MDKIKVVINVEGACYCDFEQGVLIASSPVEVQKTNAIEQKLASGLLKEVKENDDETETKKKK